ncbi:hypothetical protein SORBI_3010G117050 [Sorghum bicolor]|uniref:Uncharacterized protein n=1 Tax=Sorghum bicolor TaxID=4558 RepID=A0A1W0VSH3_SORBI|nr:hypothetical protein SORBI_3010G117050 [Sorghum bicolor]
MQLVCDLCASELFDAASFRDVSRLQSLQVLCAGCYVMPMAIVPSVCLCVISCIV